MNNMPIRIMDFKFDADELKPYIPSMTEAFGFSMTLPYLEPYLIRTMREAVKLTTDESVAAEVRQFVGQEAQHFRQHRKLNDLLRNCHPNLAGLQEIEDQMDADYKRFTKHKSLKFNLAYAEGFEAATCAWARATMEAMDANAELPDISRLFIWHLTEEIEHRTVAFNIYEHLFGGYFYKLIISIYGQYHFFKYVIKFSRFIDKNQPPKTEQEVPTGIPKNGYKIVWSLVKKWGATYMPWYNPANIELPKSYTAFSKIYSEEALETRG